MRVLIIGGFIGTGTITKLVHELEDIIVVGINDVTPLYVEPNGELLENGEYYRRAGNTFTRQLSIDDLYDSSYLLDRESNDPYDSHVHVQRKVYSTSRGYATAYLNKAAPSRAQPCQTNYI